MKFVRYKLPKSTKTKTKSTKLAPLHMIICVCMSINVCTSTMLN